MIYRFCTKCQRETRAESGICERCAVPEGVPEGAPPIPQQEFIGWSPVSQYRQFVLPHGTLAIERKKHRRRYYVKWSKEKHWSWACGRREAKRFMGGDYCEVYTAA